MAEHATQKFKDDKGEVVGRLFVDITSTDNGVATVRWKIVDRNGNPLTTEAAMKVPHPTHGEANADDLLMPVIDNIVKARVDHGGSDTASSKAKNKPRIEEAILHEEDWDLIMLLMKRLSRSRSRSRSRAHDDDHVLGRVLSLLGR